MNNYLAAKTRNIMLFFLSKPGSVVYNSFDLDNYCLMLCMPSKEFKGKSVKELAEDVLYFTSCAEWFSTGRRHIKSGDIIHINTKFYMFVNKTYLESESDIMFDNPKIKLKLITIEERKCDTSNDAVPPGGLWGK